MHIIDIGTDTLDLVDTGATCGGYTAGTAHMSYHLSKRSLFQNKADELATFESDDMKSHPIPP